MYAPFFKLRTLFTFSASKPIFRPFYVRMRVIQHENINCRHTYKLYHRRSARSFDMQSGDWETLLGSKTMSQTALFASWPRPGSRGWLWAGARGVQSVPYPSFDAHVVFALHSAVQAEMMIQPQTRRCGESERKTVCCLTYYQWWVSVFAQLYIFLLKSRPPSVCDLSMLAMPWPIDL